MKSKIISSVRLSDSGHEIKNLNINLSIFCFFCIKAKEKIVFFFKQWGGRNKKAAGRILNGKTYDEMPNIMEVESGAK